jgi:CheY-like chemotaxis protein
MQFNWAGKKVLIVDNERDNLTVLQFILSFHKLDVTCAQSGEEALGLIGRCIPYAFVLVDLRMPGVSGWEIIARVRANENIAIRTLPMIAVTAHAMVGDRERVISSGFDGYVAKPIDPTTFITTIETMLRERPSKAKTAMLVPPPELLRMMKEVTKPKKPGDTALRESEIKPAEPPAQAAKEVPTVTLPKTAPFTSLKFVIPEQPADKDNNRDSLNRASS